MKQPLIAVISDVRTFDNYTWHCAPQTYLEAAIAVAGVTPIIVPAFANRIDIEAILACVDGVMATGSKTNVHPSLYDVDASSAHEPYDQDRDATSLPIMRRAVEKGIPLLAICRGFQEMNVAFGGSIATEIQELPGRWDHRSPVSDDARVRFEIRQTVEVKDNTLLKNIVENSHIRVNSLHRQAIDRLAEGLQVEALADDGTIEAVSVMNAPSFALGVQWHPEFWAKEDAPSRAIFENFGNAVRARAVNKL
jgi:putative glutamine amidotransferase